MILGSDEFKFLFNYFLYSRLILSIFTDWIETESDRKGWLQQIFDENGNPMNSQQAETNDIRCW